MFLIYLKSKQLKKKVYTHTYTQRINNKNTVCYCFDICDSNVKFVLEKNHNLKLILVIINKSAD